MYKARVNYEDQCAIIVGKWDIQPSTVQKHYESPSTTKEDPTGNQYLVVKERSSVIWAQTMRRSRETNAAGRHMVSGKG